MHSRRMDVCEEYSDPIKGHNRDSKKKKKNKKKVLFETFSGNTRLILDVSTYIVK